MTNNNLPPPSRPTIEQLKADLSVYTGLPKCQDCGWKLGSPLTDTCSCDPGNNDPERGDKHKEACDHARELQNELIDRIGIGGYCDWVSEDYRTTMDEMTKKMEGKVRGLIKMKSGIELITEERARQISDENWTAAHDDDHENGELARAAATYALPESHRRMAMRTEVRDNARGVDDPPQEYLVGMEMPILWPWEMEWWKPCPDDRIRELVKAGALIAAEIDRLKRQHHE